MIKVNDSYQNNGSIAAPDPTISPSKLKREHINDIIDFLVSKSLSSNDRYGNGVTNLNSMKYKLINSSMVDSLV